MSTIDLKRMPNYAKFIIGGLSGITSTCVVHPMDVAKSRMQIGIINGQMEQKRLIDLLIHILKREHFLNLYKGLGASLLRQAMYSSGRMGIYQILNGNYQSKLKRPPTARVSLTMGLLAGTFGAFIGTPAEVVLIRMMVDDKLPLDQRRNYKNVSDAFIRIVKDEGIRALWTGCTPTIGRAIIVNMSQLTSYTQFKQYLRTNEYTKMKNGFALHMCASTLSGIVTAIISSPIDMAKTRIQNMKIINGLKPEYTNSTDVIIKVIKNEGFFALWKGLVPYSFRIGPHTIFTFVFLEQYTKFYYKHILKTEGTSSL